MAEFVGSAITVGKITSLIIDGAEVRHGAATAYFGPLGRMLGENLMMLMRIVVGRQMKSLVGNSRRSQHP